MEDIGKELLTLYGPLGFGWIGFVYMLRRNHVMADKHHDRMAVLTQMVADRFNANTEAVAEFKTILNERFRP